MDDNDYEDTEEYLEYAETEGNADLGKEFFHKLVLNDCWSTRYDIFVAFKG
jgi:hypothetical protein